MKDWAAIKNKYRVQGSQLSSFNGSEIKDNFAGQRAGFAGQRSNASGNANGAVFSRIADSNKTITVVVTNTLTTGGNVNAIVFGAYQYPGAVQPNPGVTVTITQSSHAQVQQLSLGSPFWVNGFRLIASNVALFNNQLLITYTDPMGDVITKQFTPYVYATAAQNQTNRIDIPDYSFGVDGSTTMTVPVGPGQTLTLVLQIGGKFDASQLVNGDSPLMVANQNPLPTGLTTVVVGQ